MWEGVGDRIELQHIDTHSIGHNRVSFPVSWAAQPEAWGPSLSGTYSSIQHLLSNSSDPQLVWSPKRQLLNREPEGPLCWVLAFSTASCLQLTDVLSSPSYIIVQRPLLVGVTIALIQPIHGQGYNPDIPRLDAPVIYTGAFPILTARPGRRSIYNRSTGGTLQPLVE